MRSPLDGSVVNVYPLLGEEQVKAAVRRARSASPRWQGLGFAGRRQRLDSFRGLIARRADELVEVIHQEMCKPRGDAHLEVALVLDHLALAARNAERVLGRRRTAAGVLNVNLGASLDYRPLGVVGVIGPWNYPVFTPMGSIAYALAAGNTVVFKPSEHSTAVGAWLVERSARSCLTERSSSSSLAMARLGLLYAVAG